MMHDLAARRNHTIKVDFNTSGDIYVLADSMRLKQVLLNLISNAIKYTCEGDVIKIQIDTDGDYVQVSVADNGPGIDSELQKNLFEPFNRVGAEKSQIQGTGIGLAIARNYIRHMGGEIGVKSEPGMGAIFWVKLKPSAQQSFAESSRYTYGT